MGRIWDGLEMIWDGLGIFSGRFWTDFEKAKIREFRIEKVTFN